MPPKLLTNYNPKLTDACLQVADALKKKLGDPYFVIPALIDDTPYDEFGIEFKDSVARYSFADKGQL